MRKYKHREFTETTLHFCQELQDAEQGVATYGLRSCLLWRGSERIGDLGFMLPNSLRIYKSPSILHGEEAALRIAHAELIKAARGCQLHAAGGMYSYSPHGLLDSILK